MTPRTTRIMSWDGPLPAVGEFLRTAAGTAYAVIGITLNLRPNPKSLARLDLLKLTPADASEIPGDATIHDFAWCKRDKRRTAP
jgi:hypothetical protein